MKITVEVGMYEKLMRQRAALCGQRDGGPGLHRSGKLLDVSGASRRSGANVHQYTANGTIAQLWKIQENKDGTVTFVSKLGTVLDVSGGLMQNGRNIQAYSPNGTIAQKWVLDKN